MSKVIWFTRISAGALLLLVTFFVSCDEASTPPDLPQEVIVTGINPTAGTVGSSVTITGSGFSSDPSLNLVKFNEEVASVTASSTTSLTVTVPANATTGAITVTHGTKSATSAVFTVLIPPVVTSLSSTSGVVGGVVEINGNHFGNDCTGITVLFNGITASITACTATKLTVKIPEGATTGLVTVSTAGGTASNSIAFTIDAAVHIAGQLQAGGGNTGTYWLNGNVTQLENNPGSSFAKSVYAHNGSVYVGGNEQNAAGKQVAKYWKDNVPVVLSDGADFEFVNSIFVTDNAVYVAGSEQPVSNRKAKYWANSTEQILTDGALNADANSIFVAGANVYVAGFHVKVRENSSSTEVATIWVNGIETNLPDQGNRSSAQSVFVNGSDVYVAGNDRTLYNPVTGIGNKPQATYWKNGTPVYLNNNVNRIGYATGIFVVGNDVYVSGYEENESGVTIAKYWKNGVATELGPGYTTGIFVKGSDVYVSGYVGITPSQATYWKNSTEVTLTGGSYAWGIFVK